VRRLIVRAGSDRRRLLLVLLSASLVAAPSSAHAVDRFAEPDGDGAEPCAASDPCGLSTAVQGASSGDDVTLLGGVAPDPPYTTSALVTIQSGVTVHGAPGSRPLIQGTGTSNAAVRVSLGGTLRDVNVEHADANNAAVFVSGGTMERVHAHGTAHGCTVDGSSVVRDSVCWTENPTDSYSGVNVQWNYALGGEPELTLRNVTAVSTGGGAGLRIIGSLLGDTHLVVNATNVIASGGVADVVAGGFGCCSNVISEIVLDHSNYDSELELDDANTDARITDPGSGTNVLTEPVFVDALGGDFRQAATSTGTINLGTAAEMYGTALGQLDLDGQARNLGLAPDIGADEFPAPPAPSGLTVTPSSGSNDNNPRVQGVAPGATTVELFTHGACTTPVGFGSLAEFEGAGIAVQVADNSTTTFYAQSTDAGGMLSACSTASVTYAEVTPSAEQPPPAAAGPTGQRAAALKKCAKIKKKAKKKKKKCKARARKLPV
jgi:hypothetical protein